MLFGLVLVLLTFAGCTMFGIRPAWFPLPISAEALLYDHQFTRTLWISGAIFVVVQLLLAWTVLRGSRGSKVTSRSSHRGLEIGWSVTTAALFLTLAGLGSRGWARVPGPATGKEIIEVYSHQFAWNFRYPGPDHR